MSDARHYLAHLVESGQLNAAGFDRALVELGERPDAAGWRRTVDRLLLAGGAMMFLSGVVSFFAFNWHRLPAFGKLALAESVWLVATVLALRLDWRRASGQWALFASATLIGVLFAVIGQVYQTGAEAWQLFAVWAVLMLPWTFLARFEPLWGLWLVITLTALLAWQGVQTPGLGRWLDDGQLNLPVVVLLIGALIGWEYGGGARQHWSARVTPRLIGFALAAALSLPAWWSMLDHYYGEDFWEAWRIGLIPNAALSVLIYLAWGGASLYVYLRRRDLLLVSLPLFSGMVALLILVGRAIDRFESVYLIAMLALGMCVGIASWLRHLQRSWASEEAA